MSNEHNDGGLGTKYEYCAVGSPSAATTTAYQCYSLAASSYFGGLSGKCPAKSMVTPSWVHPFAINTVHEVWHIFWTIVPVLFCFAIARVVAQLWHRTAYTASALRFGLEFLIIMVPAVLAVNVLNDYVFQFVVFMVALVLYVMWRGKCWARAREREFDFGKRPCMLTLARSTINLLTALCILAIDFGSFPKAFRKSRTFGAGLMDVGIGLFVFSMGLVSRRPRRAADITRLMRVVAPLLFLGLARTVVIMAIDYHQDEHEYGVHLNAFFTLGLTKLFGTLLSAAVSAEVQLLFIGTGLLLFHETCLHFGLSEYVMSAAVERNTFLSANREGLCSLPGFISLYLISMYMGQWLQDKETLTFNEFKHKLRAMALVSGLLWMLTVLGVYVVGIARVTCNFTYVVWILSIAVTMTLLFMFVFDLVLDTIWPVRSHHAMTASQIEKATTTTTTGMTTTAMLKPTSPSAETDKNCLRIPTIVDAINLNGLTFFLVANILTGMVNIYLKPENRTSAEGVLILIAYMFVTTGFVFILYRCNLRVA